MLLLSISAPRAGSSWYYHMSAALIVAAGGQDALALKERYRWIFPGATENMNIGLLYGEKLLRLSLLSQFAGSFAVKSHAKPTRALRILSQMALIRSSYIYRDPRDRLVSIMNIADKQQKSGREAGSFAAIQGFEGALSAVSHSYQHYRLWHDTANTLLMRYEDLVNHTEVEMQRTADFLGLKLKAEQITQIVAENSQTQGAARHHFVRGQIGYYKEALSRAEIEKANQVLQDDILKLGYQID